ncbi:MAG TPA: alpha/beta hydrolase [Acidimicrobiales bacterium]
MARVAYDEFSYFADNAAEAGLAYAGPPTVARTSVEVRPGFRLSALVWGAPPPSLVFLHGGAQNSHTWDTVALSLDRPLVAIDLPGHGHSDGGDHSQLSLDDNAADVAGAVRALAPDADAVIGMSLGGLTTLALAGQAPDLVRRVVLVDVLPSIVPEKGKMISDFVNGPPTFPDFDAILARTIEYNPTRTESSLRRGILHNAVQLDDGSWVWRHARHRSAEVSAPEPSDLAQRFRTLWDVVSNLTVPLMLVRGMEAQSVIDDDGEAELLRRRPDARVEHVTGAGHSVQGDRPIELAALIADFVATS